LNFEDKYSFGISQGRLTPSLELQRFPSEAWQLEFHNASSLGISFVELLTERNYNKDNPVWSEEGRKEIIDLCLKSGCDIYSLCIDYIIDHSLLGDLDHSTTNHIKNIFCAAEAVGCKAVIFPLLEKSHIQKNNILEYVKIFKNFSKLANQHDLKIYIESLLNASELKYFLKLVNKKNVGAVFDTGNRVLESENIYDEIRALGNYIHHVHIKDKDSKGNNVILGTGLVNFKKVFEALEEINYQGKLNFETTRGVDPLKTASYHLTLCKFFINEAATK